MYVLPLTQSAISLMSSTNINLDQSQLQVLQSQLTSGQNISQPSDNPSGVVAVMGVSAQEIRFTQYQTNAQNGLVVAQMANGTLNDAVSVLQSARTTLLQAGNSSITPSSATGLIASLQSDYNTLLGMANTAYMGNAIFAGTSGSKTAYDSSGNYVGSGPSPSTTVAPGFSAPTVVTAPFGQSGTPTNIFSVLNQAISDLKSGNYSKVYQGDLQSFDNAFNQVTAAAATQGEYVQELQFMQNQAIQSLQNVQAQYGNLQNINYPKLTTEYSPQLSNYQIALQVVSQSVQPTLAKYI
jgi:flagellar hook-associated protein 3 FlgL